MKRNRIYIIVIIILGLALTFFYRSLSELEDRVNRLEGSEKGIDDHTGVNLVELMSYNQRFADKLYFAGQNDNWALAGFYHHELEEIFEEIIEAGLQEDGLDMSNLSERMMMPVLDSLKADIERKNKEAFLRNYQTLVNSCNACHSATRHPYIQITVPEEASVKNQRY